MSEPRTPDVQFVRHTAVELRRLLTAGEDASSFTNSLEAKLKDVLSASFQEEAARLCRVNGCAVQGRASGQLEYRAVAKTPSHGEELAFALEMLVDVSVVAAEDRDREFGMAVYDDDVRGYPFGDSVAVRRTEMLVEDSLRAWLRAELRTPLMALNAAGHRLVPLKAASPFLAYRDRDSGLQIDFTCMCTVAGSLARKVDGAVPY